MKAQAVVDALVEAGDQARNLIRVALAQQLAEKILHEFTAQGISDIKIGKFRIVTRSTRSSGSKRTPREPWIPRGQAVAEPYAYPLGNGPIIRSHLNVYDSKEFLSKFPEWYTKVTDSS